MRVVLVLLLSGILSAQAPPAVLTVAYNNSRTSANNAEAILTPTVVQSSNFRKLATCPFDSPVYVQALYVPAAQTGNTSGFNLLIVGTMGTASIQQKIYALDADRLESSCPTLPTVWTQSYGLPWNGNSAGLGLYSVPVGILAMPAVDETNRYLYFVTRSTVPVDTLHMVNYSTGVELTNTPFAPSALGAGAAPRDGCTETPVAGNVIYDPVHQLVRMGISIIGGSVYVAAGSNDDRCIWHGWIVRYDKTTLAVTNTLLLSPNSNGNGIWAPGSGLVELGNGNIAFLTGNGDGTCSSSLTMAIVVVNPALVVQSSWHPANCAAMDAADLDLASGRLVLVPGSTLLSFASKDNRMFIFDSANVAAGPTQVFAAFPAGTNAAGGNYEGLFVGTSTSGAMYLIGSTSTSSSATAPLSKFVMTSGTYATTPSVVTGVNFYKADTSSSSNGGAQTLITIKQVTSSPYPGTATVTMQVYDTSLTKLFDSGGIGNISKWIPPLVVNGRIFASVLNASTGFGDLLVFGAPPVASSVRAIISGGASVR